MVFFAILIFQSFISTTEAKIYIDDEYGFWIEYPDNWYFEDTRVEIEPYPGINDGTIIFPSFRDGVRYWYDYASVTLMKNSTIAANNEGTEFMDIVINDLNNSCDLASFEVQGFVCKNHEIVGTNVTNINGLSAYEITDTWLEIYQDGQNATKISMITDIIVENDLWQIDIISVKSKGNFTEIKQIPQSFKFLDESTYYQQSKEIPDWVRNNASWWADDIISDSEFSQALQYLINEKIIIVPETILNDSSQSNEIPSWIKNSAGWWAEGSVKDDSFMQGIQYMVKEGIIKIN
jgi:hypothetical protein